MLTAHWFLTSWTRTPTTLLLPFPEFVNIPFTLVCVRRTVSCTLDWSQSWSSSSVFCPQALPSCLWLITWSIWFLLPFCRVRIRYLQTHVSIRCQPPLPHWSNWWTLTRGYLCTWPADWSHVTHAHTLIGYVRNVSSCPYYEKPLWSIEAV